MSNTPQPSQGLSSEVYTRWCGCGAPLLADAPPDALCGPCRRHNARRDKANGIIVDCMIIIARAAAAEKAFNDSRPVENARKLVLTKMVELDGV